MEVYLDTAATSWKKPECVYVAMDRFMREVGASPGRSVHGPGIEAGRIVEGARESVARLFGVEDESRIVFTLNCTEALNLAIKGMLEPGGHVVTTCMEHNSVMRPLSAMIEERGVSVTKVRASGEGVTDIDDLKGCIRPETSLVVMTHASNVTGAVQPIEECGRIAAERGIPFLVDAAQTAGLLPIDLSSLPVDMLAFSGHKGLMGPQGVGGLFIGEGVEPASLKQGGTGSRSSEEIHPDMLPDRYESGTPNTPGLAGLGASVGFVLSETVEAIRAKVCRVGNIVMEGLEAMGGITAYGPSSMERNAGVFSFRVNGRDNAETARALESSFGIMTRVGLQCAPSAHRSIGTFPEGTVRVSIGYNTTEDEIRYFLECLHRIT